MAEKKRGTIRPSLDVYERHNQRRKDRGMGWDEYLDAEAPELPGVGVENVEVDEEALADAIVRSFDYSQVATLVADELETRLGR